MKPLIGITSTKVSINPQAMGCYVADGYYNGVAKCGGIPIVIPLLEDEELIKEIIDRTDALIFTGGEDIGPHHYGEMPHRFLGEVFPLRDQIELMSVRYSLSKDKPILGICRGAQLINVAMGGTLYQDLPSQMKDSSQHMQKAPRPDASHYVSLQKGSKLFEIFQKGQVFSNSFHHQAVKDLAPHFMIAAQAEDGVVEGIESTVHQFALGIQWHPEMMWGKSEEMLQVCQYFIDYVKSQMN
ncbi:gamma-glutamyl-gamma-aminobutyrate hydrolase family protein [Paenibacillus sp. GP183]|uniref:gamma-glutamyl-gamma-aminobutyrate hydrolase family protein n=1 Tax=Paenibacillus sp. GP183 TaxID=1882751 RepID=UPI000899C36C|nr:gamma-glutamyl-gamma-aminobutyrate hydrolase family protein [Paenibacillus sp. GP183]SEC13787.1 putative glutamine amidotransferase [Paenibacillus sp. GP183]